MIESLSHTPPLNYLARAEAGAIGGMDSTIDLSLINSNAPLLENTPL